MERENINSNNENNIEFLTNAETATCSFSQGRYVSRMKKLAEKYPDDVQITAENKDGSIVAHFPVKWVKINPPKQLSEETREKLAEQGRRNLLNYTYNQGD